MKRLSALLVLCFATAGWSQDRVADAQKLADVYLSNSGVVGLSAAVVIDGKVALSIQAGYADQTGKRKVSSDTLFRLGSISKSVTAVGAMKLIEAKKLALTDTAERLAPEWPKGRKPITLAQLLSHTAGVRHYLPGDSTGRVFKTYTSGEAIGLFSKEPLLFEPGAKESYSTHAYTVIARMMETAGGTSFVEFMRKNVFREDLDCEVAAEPKADRSELYTLAVGGAKHEPKREDNSWKYAGGGMEASAEGLAKWADQLRAGKLLGGDALTTLWTPATLNNGTKLGYALGWRIDGSLALHSGAQQGCRSFLAVDREKKVTVVVLTNTGGNHSPGTLANDLRKLVDSAGR